MTLRDAAMQFPVFNHVVKSSVIGCGTIEHLHECIDSMSKKIPVALWQALKAEGFINARAYVPGDK